MTDGTSLLQTRMQETLANRALHRCMRRQEPSELRCKPTECVAGPAAAGRTVRATVRSANLMARTQSISIAPGVRFFRPLRFVPGLCGPGAMETRRNDDPPFPLCPFEGDGLRSRILARRRGGREKLAIERPAGVEPSRLTPEISRPISNFSDQNSRKEVT
jgi:hypothetical protein